MEVVFLTREDEQTASSDMLVLAHAPLVKKMAHNFARYGVDVEDLVQEGNVALTIAASKFEPERGFRFSTYAHYWISQFMRECVIRDHSVVRGSKTSKAKQAFFKKRPHFDVSTETPLSGSGFTLGDTFVSADPLPDEMAENAIDGEIMTHRLHEALGSLSEREAAIISGRFLCEKKTPLERIGEDFGVSKERVRQIEKAALEKLRKALDRNSARYRVTG